MSNQEILQKAINKAKANGWQPISWREDMPLHVDQWQGNGMVIITQEPDPDTMYWSRELEGIIFNHDFAKALWGEKLLQWSKIRVDTGERITFIDTAWRMHLQQMVTANDPIQYLGENI